LLQSGMLNLHFMLKLIVINRVEKLGFYADKKQTFLNHLKELER